jgi:hypothetical protein
VKISLRFELSSREALLEAEVTSSKKEPILPLDDGIVTHIHQGRKRKGRATARLEHFEAIVGAAAINVARRKARLGSLLPSAFRIADSRATRTKVDKH